jgi:hypothetical protein
MPYNWYHTANLARPKTSHPLHIPDKASVYWVDYLLDERPHKITNPGELYEYYQGVYKKYPRVEKLAEPKPWPESGEESRPTTAYGN